MRAKIGFDLIGFDMVDIQGSSLHSVSDRGCKTKSIGLSRILSCNVTRFNLVYSMLCYTVTGKELCGIELHVSIDVCMVLSVFFACLRMP